MYRTNSQLIEDGGFPGVVQANDDEAVFCIQHTHTTQRGRHMGAKMAWHTPGTLSVHGTTSCAPSSATFTLPGRDWVRAAQHGREAKGLLEEGGKKTACKLWSDLSQRQGQQRVQ